MSASFKNSGWLEGLNDTVMTEDVRSQFAQGYLKNMITDKDGNIVGVPGCRIRDAKPSIVQRDDIFPDLHGLDLKGPFGRPFSQTGGCGSLFFC